MTKSYAELKYLADKAKQKLVEDLTASGFEAKWVAPYKLKVNGLYLYCKIYAKVDQGLIRAQLDDDRGVYRTKNIPARKDLTFSPALENAVVKAYQFQKDRNEERDEVTRRLEESKAIMDRIIAEKGYYLKSGLVMTRTRKAGKVSLQFYIQDYTEDEAGRIIDFMAGIMQERND